MHLISRMILLLGFLICSLSNAESGNFANLIQSQTIVSLTEDAGLKDPSNRPACAVNELSANDRNVSPYAYMSQANAICNRYQTGLVAINYTVRPKTKKDKECFFVNGDGSFGIINAREYPGVMTRVDCAIQKN